MEKLILAINPGSTTTKIALYRGETLLKVETIRHQNDIFTRFPVIYAQKEYRLNYILQFLQAINIDIKDIDAFVGRGGLLKPLKRGGTYKINTVMLDDLRQEHYGSHACNLGAPLAYELASINNKPAYIVDPVIIDELDDIARVSGFKGIDRISVFHALNHKAIAKRYAKDINKRYEDLNLIVAHLGSGISVGWHKHGRIVDVNNALGGQGPFTPERAGTLPFFQLIELCYSGKYQKEELKKMLVTKGGLVSYLGTSDGLEIKNRIDNGDHEAKFYLEALAYQVTKEIGGLYMAAGGKIDTLILTGGLAHFSLFVQMVMKNINNIIPIVIYPGENEMESLIQGVLRVLNEEEEPLEYV
jgi:butyrate kinase